jgi:hypothetical protein
MQQPTQITTEAALIHTIASKETHLAPEWQAANAQTCATYDALYRAIITYQDRLPPAQPQYPSLSSGFWNFILQSAFQQRGLLAPVQAFLEWRRAYVPAPQQHDVHAAEVAFLTQLQHLVNLARGYAGWPVATPAVPPVPVAVAPTSEDASEAATVPAAQPVSAATTPDLADAPTLVPAQDPPGSDAEPAKPPTSLPTQPAPFLYLSSIDEHLAVLPQQGQELQRQATALQGIADEFRGVLAALADRVSEYQAQVARGLHLTATAEGFLREPLGQGRDAMINHLIALIARFRDLWNYRDTPDATLNTAEWRDLAARERIFYDSIERFLCEHFQVERIPIQPGDRFNSATMAERGNSVATTDATRDETVEAVLAPGLQLMLPNGAREVRLVAYVRLFHYAPPGGH